MPRVGSFLEVWKDGKRLADAPLSGSNITVGRRANVTYQLLDARASGEHCVFSFCDGVLCITDRSTNGTYVNGERIAPKIPLPLADGDVVSPVVNTKKAPDQLSDEQRKMLIIGFVYHSGEPPPPPPAAAKKPSPAPRAGVGPARVDDKWDTLVGKSSPSLFQPRAQPAAPASSKAAASSSLPSAQAEIAAFLAEFILTGDLSSMSMKTVKDALTKKGWEAGAHYEKAWLKAKVPELMQASQAAQKTIAAATSMPPPPDDPFDAADAGSPLRAKPSKGSSSSGSSSQSPRRVALPAALSKGSPLKPPRPPPSVTGLAGNSRSAFDFDDDDDDDGVFTTSSKQPRTAATAAKPSASVVVVVDDEPAPANDGWRGKKRNAPPPPPKPPKGAKKSKGALPTQKAGSSSTLPSIIGIGDAPTAAEASAAADKVEASWPPQKRPKPASSAAPSYRPLAAPPPDASAAVPKTPAKSQEKHWSDGYKMVHPLHQEIHHSMGGNYVRPESALRAPGVVAKAKAPPKNRGPKGPVTATSIDDVLGFLRAKKADEQEEEQDEEVDVVD